MSVLERVEAALRRLFPRGMPATAAVADAVAELSPLLSLTATDITTATAEAARRSPTDATALAVAAALIAHHPESPDEAARALCAALWDIVASADASSPAVQCAAHCASCLHPAHSAALVDEALRCVAGEPETAFQPLAAVEVTAALVPGAAADLQERLLDTAMRGAAAYRSDDAVVPAVVRRLTIPLVRASAELAAKQREASVALLARMVAAQEYADAAVFMAAMFDVLFVDTAADLRLEGNVWTVLMALLTEPEVGERAPKIAQARLMALYLLKRIVASVPASPLRGEHALFPWDAAASEGVWTTFFLIFESLAEYGLHIVTPAMAKLAELERHDAMPRPWVQLLLSKALTHANLGVRRFTLKLIWTGPFVLDPAFLCTTVMETAGDARLCQEVDTVVLPGTFLDCKAFEGIDQRTLPVVEPTARRFVDYVVAYLRPLEADAQQRCVCRLIRTVDSLALARFAICLLLRLLAELPRAGVVALSAEAVELLHAFVLNSVQDKHPFWLEARYAAAVVEALRGGLTTDGLAAPQLAALVSSLGSGGACGGSGLAAIDNCGGGTNGSPLPHPVLLRHLLTPEVLAAAPVQQAQTAWARFTAEGTCSMDAARREVALVSPHADTSELCTALLSLPTRTEMEPRALLRHLALYAALGDNGAPFPAAVHAAVLGAVMQRGPAWLSAAGAVYQAGDFDAPEWAPMATEAWDCAAAATVVAAGAVGAEAAAALDIAAWATALLQATAALRAVQPPAELGRLVVVRNAVRLVSAVLSPLLPAAPALATPSLAGLRKALLRMRPLRLKTNTPCPLTAHTWGSITAQAYRSVWQALLVVLRADPAGAEDIVSEAEDQLDCCSNNNVSCIFDVVCWGLVHAPDALSDSRAVAQSLVSFAQGGLRREVARCQALLAHTLVATGEKAHVAAVEAMVLDAPDLTDRQLFSVVTAVAQRVLLHPTEYDRWARLLLEVALFVSTSNDDGELEACVACTEPLFTQWPELRRDTPPSVQLNAVARASALAAILAHAKACPATVAPFVTRLVEMNIEDKRITKSPCMPNSDTHRSRLRLWQLTCALTPLVTGAAWGPLFTYVVDKLIPLNNMGSVRRYVELFCMGAVAAAAPLAHVVLDRLDDLHIRAQECGSLALVAIHALIRYQDDEAIFGRVFTFLVRLCSSHQHLLRLIAQIGLHYVVKDLGLGGARLTPEVASLVEYVATSTDCTKFRDKHLSVVIYDELLALSPRHIFCVQRKEGELWTKDAIPVAAFDRVQRSAVELACLLGARSVPEVDRCNTMVAAVADPVAVQAVLQGLELIPHGDPADAADGYIDYMRDVLAVEEEGAAEATDNLQRKVTSWWASEVHNELHPRALGTKDRQEVVVVTTLLDNPVNVAGLCRCAEIFAIDHIVVSHKKVFAHPHFVAVARSAELWLPWEEVSEANLPEYLTEMRGRGYTIAGVEQTADSVPLNTYPFPKRTVIVLGAEGTGIPAPLLPYLDKCLEIPQFGLIRSLNVHVSGAIALYEFTKQHLMSDE